MSETPRPSGDWAAQTADTIERVVLTVRDRTTKPLVTLARALVFGLLAGILGIAALVLVCIVAIRALSYLPGGVWVAYLIAGALFTLVGIVCMAKRGTLDSSGHA